jgi:hypothetical protein
MPRLEVELTSARPDGSWTWRKAGARQPKGEMAGELVPPSSKVGDVLRVEAEAMLDGIEITAVLPPKGERTERFERIELKGRPAPEQLVSTTLAPRGKGEGRGRGDRPGRRRERGEGGERGRGPREGRDDRPRQQRPPRPPAPERPKPKRIRPLRTHRDAVLESLPPEQRPIAEQVLKGGVPAVRQALDAQNAQLREAGQPEVPGDELIALAERLVPQLRAAEWRDRADAAKRIVDEVDLRDLRSVVVAADVGRDEESRALAAELKEALGRRVEEEHAAWLRELSELLDQERIVRALRVSSRPPKAGVPLPAELAGRLAEQASAALTAETAPDRWATVLDALSFAPVRTSVRPASLPDPVPDAVLDAVKAVVDRLPHIAEAFGVDPASVPRSAKRRGPAGAQRRGGGGGGKKPIPPPPTPPAEAPEAPQVEAAAVEPMTPSEAALEDPETVAEPAASAVHEPEPAPAAEPEPMTPSEAALAPEVDAAAEPQPEAAQPEAEQPTGEAEGAEQ